MTQPAWIKGRWVIVPGFLAITITLWNLYVAAHNSGALQGRVVDTTGRPVADATVTLFERSFVAYTTKDKTKTDSSGFFRFADNQNHALQLEAESPELGKSERLSLRLWFRGQDTTLADPLRLEGRKP